MIPGMTLADAAMLARISSGYPPNPDSDTADTTGWTADSDIRSADGGIYNPGVSVSDDFDSYANDAFLGDEPNWTINQGSVQVKKPFSDGTVVGNTAAFAHWSADIFNANHRSEATLSGTAGGGAFALVAVRADDSAATGYTFFTEGSTWYLIDYIAGAQHVITSGTAAVAAGDKIALEATGAGSATRLTLQKYTSGAWSDVAAAVDPGSSHYIDGGSPGVGGQDNGASGLRITYWAGFDI